MQANQGLSSLGCWVILRCFARRWRSHLTHTGCEPRPLSKIYIFSVLFPIWVHENSFTYRKDGSAPRHTCHSRHTTKTHRHQITNNKTHHCEAQATPHNTTQHCITCTTQRNTKFTPQQQKDKAYRQQENKTRSD